MQVFLAKTTMTLYFPFIVNKATLLITKVKLMIFGLAL